MSTFVLTGMESLESRLNEINVLIEQAKLNDLDITNELNETDRKKYELYNALCRSVQVLLVSHYEGAINEFVKCILEDINHNSSFKNSPTALKRSFCESFLPRHDGKFSTIKVNNLVETFDSLPINYKVDSFIYDNKNLAPKRIETIAQKFGIENLLSIIEDSKLNLVFEDNESQMKDLRDELNKHLLEAINVYPYQIDLNLFELSIKEKNNRKSKSSLWPTFLENILENRCNIAHGTTILNSAYHSDIEKATIKVEILIYAFILVICKYIMEKSYE